MVGAVLADNTVAIEENGSYHLTPTGYSDD
jgi:hypothetical protein